MSIVGEANPQSAYQNQLGPTVATLAILLIISLVTAFLSGVFRRRCIVGRTRIAPTESLWPFYLAFAVGWLILFAGPGILLVHPTGPSSLPTESRYTDQQLLTVQLVNTLLLISFLAIFTARTRKTAALGLSPSQIIPAIPRALLGGLVAIPLVMAASIVTELVIQHLSGNHDQFIHPMLKMLNESTVRWQETVIVLSATLTAPIAEEILFRGYLQSLLAASTAHWFGDSSDSRPRWIAVLLTSAAFAILHPQWSWVAIFILAICLGYAYERTGNLWVPMLMHASFNTIEVTLNWFANHVQLHAH